jgi:hypothetical protein
VSYRASYWKTTGAAFLLAAPAVGSIPLLNAGSLPATPVRVIDSALALFAFCMSLVGCAGLVCLWRDAREAAGKPDVYALDAGRVPTQGLLARLGLRFLLGPQLRPGDRVRVKPLAEIAATLDADRTLDSLPFMREMEAFCGQTFVVHRRVDKINDMRHKTGLRRMRNTVTLTAVRCSGAHHGDCQAECQILWKEAWLEKATATQTSRAPHGPDARSLPPEAALDRGPDTTYVCQMTRLWEASTPMSRADIRQDLRPLLNGNVSLGAYLVALLTRLFNRVQSWRGGSGYPYMPPSPPKGVTPASAFTLHPGEPVVILGKDEIARTLVNSRNKGLWFDRDMIRFCGQAGIVRRRVERVIHEATGRMVVMRTPCVTLDENVATGEFLRLCPQHEYIFWREAWLRPQSRPAIVEQRAASS